MVLMFSRIPVVKNTDNSMHSKNGNARNHSDEGIFTICEWDSKLHMLQYKVFSHSVPGNG